MLDQKFLEVLKKEGVAPIVTWSNDEPNLAATWNSYIQKTEDTTLLIPVAEMHNAQENLAKNDKVKMIVGSKEVQGMYGQGAGFLIEGTATIIRDGEKLAMMQKKFDWAKCVMEVKVEKVIQTA